jgi:hypothetical protein
MRTTPTSTSGSKPRLEHLRLRLSVLKYLWNASEQRLPRPSYPNPRYMLAPKSISLHLSEYGFLLVLVHCRVFYQHLIRLLLMPGHEQKLGFRHVSHHFPSEEKGKCGTPIYMVFKSQPPSASISDPTTKDESSEARNSATLATSSGRPKRLTGERLIRATF